ncbi:MAG: hypothetical protein ABUK20_15375 [Anaerolineales bacterium]
MIIVSILIISYLIIYVNVQDVKLFPEVERGYFAATELELRRNEIYKINQGDRTHFDSDLMVYLTPVSFGGYSPSLKSIVDHQIQKVLPTVVHRHHQLRIPRSISMRHRPGDL